MNNFRIIITAFILLLLISCTRKNKTLVSNDAFIIYNANIIDVASGIIYKNKAILIDSGLIKQIDNFEKLKTLTPSSQQLNIHKKYIIPGLWDMHSHIDKLSSGFEHSKSMLSLYTLNGVTSIREMGGDFKTIMNLKASTKNKKFLPSIYTAGPILENKDFVDWVAKIDNDPLFKKQRVSISNKNEVERIIDSVKQLGVDFIKIRTAASKEVFFEIAKQAKRNGLKLAGHVDAKVDLYEAIKAGISSLEHLDIFQLSGMSNNKMDSIASLMKAMKTNYCPTISYFKNHRIYDKKKIISFINDTIHKSKIHRSYVSNRLLRKSKLAIKRAEESQVPWKKMEANFLKFAKILVNKNVSIIAGTDGANALSLPGFGLHEELLLYKSELNMTPLQILQTATINPSKYFGLENKYGSIKKGYTADLVILDKNPLINIQNIKTVNSVIKSGKLISKNEILRKLKSISEYHLK